MRDLIIAPHVDDECIGCHSILRGRTLRTVVYLTEGHSKVRIQEATAAAQYFGFTALFTTLLKLPAIIGGGKILEWDRVFVPDPNFDTHHKHKEAAYLVSIHSRVHYGPGGIRFHTYSVDMNAPYIRELGVKEQEQKKRALNDIYLTQTSLWENDYKYWLFEGICEWNPRG